MDILLSRPPQKQCKASSNVIEKLPNTVSIFWRTQLQEVDFSDNSLKELPSYIFELEVGTIIWICYSAQSWRVNSDNYLSEIQTDAFI